MTNKKIIFVIFDDMFSMHFQEQTVKKSDREGGNETDF